MTDWWSAAPAVEKPKQGGGQWWTAAPEVGAKPLSEEAKGREQQRSTFADTLKSIPGAIVSGLTSFGSLSEQGRRGLIGIQDEAPAQTAPQAKAAIEKNITGTLPKAQTSVGKVVEAGVESASNPLSYLGASGPIRGFVSALGGGVGGEIAGQLTNDNPLARGFGGAAGGLAGGTKGPLTTPTLPAATRGAIRDAAETAYDTIKTSPRKIPMEESSIVAEGIRKKLNDEGVYREAPDGVSVFKTVDRLTQAINAGHITPAEIHGITKTLQKIQRSNPGNSTGRAAEIARQELFDYLKKFPELEEAINVGNANYRVFKTSERIGEAQEKGQFQARSTMTGDNIDPALRTQMRQLYFNKKVYKTPEEKEILRSIIEGDTASNIGKKFNLLKSPLRHLGIAIMHAQGGPRGVTDMMLHGAQMLMKSISNRSTARQVEKLDELVRGTAPASPLRPTGPGEPSTRGRQRGIQAARGALTGQKDEKPQLYEQ